MASGKCRRRVKSSSGMWKKQKLLTSRGKAGFPDGTRHGQASVIRTIIRIWLGLSIHLFCLLEGTASTTFAFSRVGARATA